MSILETTLIFGGIPLLVIAVVGGLSYLSNPIPGKHPEHYDLGKSWTHAPVLWSATDEVTSHGHHGGHAAIAAAPADLIGGKGSGKW
ncbi:hypothetical protein JGU71_26140 [Antrihabitans sp. YC3-6]|uniref:Uncharacterized protein n=1 Tax=Antrihabitans stalagmiti TaxID=2799499 RepID=A0A934U6F2_9NOCA|nr:hypothetical protein [Antrihabitans stalagmiti]MBJ8342377.1 hypothetical protein [Antrihabitans stalagmiti]